MCGTVAALTSLNAASDTMTFPCPGSPIVPIGDVRMAICDGNPEAMLTVPGTLILRKSPVIGDYIRALVPGRAGVTRFGVLPGSPDDRDRLIETYVEPETIQVAGVFVSFWQHQRRYVYRGRLSDGTKFVVGCADRTFNMRRWRKPQGDVFSLCSVSVALTENTMVEGRAFDLPKDGFMAFAQIVLDTAQALQRD